MDPVSPGRLPRRFTDLMRSDDYGRSDLQELADHVIDHRHAIGIQPRIRFVHQYEFEGSEPKGRQ